MRAAAALALLVGLFVGLIKIFSVVGDLANWGISRGRDFHQVEPFFLGQLYGFKRLHDAELAALIINHPDFASADSFVDANAVALPEAAFCDKSPSSTSFFAARKRPTNTHFSRVELRTGPKFITHPTRRESARGRAPKYSTRSRSSGKRQKGVVPGFRREL